MVRAGGTVIVEVNNAFYAGFMGLLRDRQNLRWHRSRGANRTYVMFPGEVRRLFAGLGEVEYHGVYLPLLYRVHRYAPRLAARLAGLSSFGPFTFLSKNLLIRVRVGGDRRP